MRKRSNQFILLLQNAFSVKTESVNKLSYRVFHPSSLFTQSLSFLPAHLFQHFPPFIDFTDLPLRTQVRHNTWLPLHPLFSFFSNYSQWQYTYLWTEAGASSRWKTPSLPTVCRRDSARSLYLGFFRALASSYSLLCWQKSTEVIKRLHKEEEEEEGLNWLLLVLITLTCRPYLAFICFSSFCLNASLSSLVREGPLGRCRAKLNVPTWWGKQPQLVSAISHGAFVCKNM